MYLPPATLTLIVIRLLAEGQCSDSMHDQDNLSSPWNAEKLWISRRVLTIKKYGVFPQESDREVKLYLNSPPPKSHLCLIYFYMFI
jgi:hypothetical protein